MALIDDLKAAVETGNRPAAEQLARQALDAVSWAVDARRDGRSADADAILGDMTAAVRPAEKYARESPYPARPAAVISNTPCRGRARRATGRRKHR